MSLPVGGTTPGLALPCPWAETLLPTASGRLLDISSLAPSEIRLEDVATGLSRQVRWAGQTPRPYFVAQHSCLLALWTYRLGHPRSLVLACLFHDAEEAYLGDSPSPVKELYRLRQEEGPRSCLRAELLQAVFERFEISWDLLKRVKAFDRALAWSEFETFFPLLPPPFFPYQPGRSFPMPIEPWSSENSFRTFVEIAHRMLLPHVRR